MKKFSKKIIILILSLVLALSGPADTVLALSTAPYDREASGNVSRIVAEAGKYDTDYDRLRYIVAWLTENNNYNEELLEKYEQGYDGDDYAYYAVSALVPGLSPVCDGFAKAFKRICDRIGLPCYYAGGLFEYVSDDGYPDGGNHAWNYVKLDKKWYLIDLTDIDTGEGTVYRVNWHPALFNLDKHLYGERGLENEELYYEPEENVPAIAERNYNSATARPSYESKRSGFKLSSTSVILAKRGRKASVKTIKNKSLKVSSTNKKVATAKYSKKTGKITITAKKKGSCKIKVKYRSAIRTIKVTVKQ